MIELKRFSLFVAAAYAIYGFAPASAAQLPHSMFTIASALAVDTTNHTATLPLYRGRHDGMTVWYIITDASDAGVARRFGVNFAPSLASIGAAATQRAIKNSDGTYTFEDAPDFSAARTYIAGPAGFPPQSATPGGNADREYSPFVRAQGIAGVLNASIVATGDGPFDVTTHGNTEDRVLAIDTAKKTVTVALARGFFDDKPVYYLSPEASDAGAAAVERATYTPNLAKAASSAQIPIGVVVDGPQTGDAPQGLAYLSLRTPLGEDATLASAASVGSPFNLLSVAPDLAHPYAANAYAPLWNAMVVTAPQSTRFTNYGEVAAQAKPAGFVVNCPVVAYGELSY
ncbi:MAG TPA: hypothetical protein VMF11_02795 [Candidatus Baltobacteraceae bacterium]|nr:hypothetical protein [Candidatus Baltobacteraceae bacterium]